MRYPGDPLGDVQYPVVQLVGGKGPVGVADPYGLGCVHGVAGEHHLHGVPEPYQPGMHGEVRRSSHPQDRVGDGGVVGQVDEVAGGDEF